MSKEDRYAHLGDELEDSTDDQPADADADAADADADAGDESADDREHEVERPTGSDGVLVTISDADDEFRIRIDEADATAADLHGEIRRHVDRHEAPSAEGEAARPGPESTEARPRSTLVAGVALGSALTAGIAAVLRRRRGADRGD